MDTIPTMIAFFLAAVPSFVVGIVLMYIFALKLGWFHSYGLKSVSDYVLPVVSSLRKSGIKVELYPDKAKLKKQFEYASKKGIRYLAIAGENEISEGTASVKDIISGEQKNIKIDELLSFLIGKN